MEKEQGSDPYTCPSFSSYSEIAVRAAAEGVPNDAVQSEYDEDFEFALVRHDAEVPAGDGRTGADFPVFDLDLLRDGGGDGELTGESERLDVSLGELFIEDGDDNNNNNNNNNNNPASCSSSEADELENIPAGWYCVWRPKAADQTPASECKKSKSTGSAPSKRWRFCDFLLRSNSEGEKGNFVILSPKSRVDKLPVEAKGNRVGSAHEALYVRKRSIMEGNKRKTYLPYRRDLIGFFVNVDGFGKSFPRF